MITPGVAVGGGVLDHAGEGVVDREELETEIVRLVGFTMGVEVVAGGRLEEGRNVDVDVHAGEIENADESGVGWIALPFQTNRQEVWDRASSTVLQS